MMMAVGCIQAQRCHTNTCPVGVTTQDPKRMRALVIPDKAQRVHRFQEATVAQAVQMIASMGLDGPHQLHPHHVMRRVDHTITRSYADLYDWLAPGELLTDPPEDWALDWQRADADTFAAGH
jgi:Conserved region in glutamate synthase